MDETQLRSLLEQRLRMVSDAIFRASNQPAANMPYTHAQIVKAMTWLNEAQQAALHLVSDENGVQLYELGDMPTQPNVGPGERSSVQVHPSL